MQATATAPALGSAVTLEQAQRIVDLHRPAKVVSLNELDVQGFSAFTQTTIYVIELSGGTAYALKVAPLSTQTTPSAYAPNSLESEHALLQLVATQTDIPHPDIIAFDTSLATLPHPYLLLSHPRGTLLSHARASGSLSPRQSLLLDLRMGAYLKQLHERVQNDWFGLPSQARAELYSWQEAFTGLLEALLTDAEARGVRLPYADVRQYLSRAIGFFLFDDCDVPSLVSFAGDADAVLVDLEGAADDVPVAAFLSFSHALWGDPLLETMFVDPSAALIEGYGGPLVLFARQKTKRIWYTLFLALMVTVHMRRDGHAASDGQDGEKVKWADAALSRCVADLKDAPYY
ncbi:hypothetical protein B0H21DRAFT_779484 [Amylocystis lapponica]|nr:hypothetical protein B0H21DRAFT_779484 [Amylocystis lapponica]